MKQLTVSKTILLATFLSLGASAQTGVGRGSNIKYIAPQLFSFTLSPMVKNMTDCSQLKRLLTNYISNRCDTAQGTNYCQSIFAQIQIAQTLDTQNDNPMEDFSRGYVVTPFTNLPDPAEFSKRFDISYASSYDFNVNDLGTPRAFHFEGNITNAELSVESKLGSNTGFELVALQGKNYVKVGSKIRACALESGRISIIGNSRVSVSGSHPVGNIAYEIVEETYRKAISISEQENLTTGQKNFLLGLLAGEQLKKMSTQISDAKELDEVALSLQSVVMDATKSKFTLIPADLNARLGITLIEPGFIVPNAAIQITYKGE